VFSKPDITYGFVILSLVSFIVVYGLLARKSWGRGLAIVVSVVLIIVGLFFFSVVIGLTAGGLWPIALFILGFFTIPSLIIIKYLDGAHIRAYFKKV